MAQLYHTFPQLIKKSYVPGVVHKAGGAYLLLRTPDAITD